MVALQIRDVPDEVRETLAELAATRGQSLQAFLLVVITDEARRSRNIALLTALNGREDGSRLSTAEADGAVQEYTADRDRRHVPPNGTA